MSSNKRLCLRSDSQNSHSFSDCLVNKFESKEDNYRRDSFDDRFCDYLSEVILQYLPLKDKLRLEGVSKQFQRIVFQRQYDLYIKGREQNVILSDSSNSYYNFNNRYIEVQSLNLIKALLKKCPNITTIELDRHQNKVQEVFRLIIQNCNNLREIIILCAINNINSNLQEFCRKFGPKLKSFESLFPLDIWDLNRFTNIEKVIINYMYEPSTIPQLELAKLKQLEVGIVTDEERTSQTIIDTFPTLTHFNVSTRSGYENAFYKSLKNISNLKHLIHFKLSFGNQFGINNRFCDLFKQMANNCRNLKSIDLDFKINQQNSDIKQLLFLLKAFPALKRLNH